MAKDLFKFDLLMVTEGYDHVDSIGLMLYTRCPNFDLHFASSVTDAISKARLHNPDVFIVDEVLRKQVGFREFEEVLEQSEGIVFSLLGAETCGCPGMGTATTLPLATTISGEELEKRLGNVAEELLWRKLSSGGLKKS